MSPPRQATQPQHKKRQLKYPPRHDRLVFFLGPPAPPPPHLSSLPVCEDGARAGRVRHELAHPQPGRYQVPSEGHRREAQGHLRPHREGGAARARQAQDPRKGRGDALLCECFCFLWWTCTCSVVAFAGRRVFLARRGRGGGLEKLVSWCRKKRLLRRSVCVAAKTDLPWPLVVGAWHGACGD